MSRHQERPREKSPASRAPASETRRSNVSLHDPIPEDVSSIPKHYVNPLFGRGNEHEPTKFVSEDESNFTVGPKRAGSRSRTRVDEVADEFARTVPLNNMAECKSFIIKNPDLLREADLDDQYLHPAVQALAIGTDASRLSAWSYMEKYTVIECIKNYHSREKGSFLDIIMKNDSSAKELMTKKFTAVKKDCENRAQRKTSEKSDRHPMQNSSSREVPKIIKGASGLTLGRRETEHVEHSTPQSKDLDRYKDPRGAKPKGSERAIQRVEYSSYGKGFDRHRDPPGAKLKVIERAARPVEYTSYGADPDRHKEPEGATLKGMEREGKNDVDDEITRPTASRIGRRHTMTGPWQPELGRVNDIPEEDPGGAASQAGVQPPSVASIDHRFQSLPTKGWKWFQIGCVFAIKLYSEDSRDYEDFSEVGFKDRQGRRVFIKVRRHVVVNTKHGLCHVVPILTYGGKGLHKPGLSDSNIKAHARIHMKNRDPRWLDTPHGREPRTNKKDMVVQPTSDNALPLDDASRICFERTHTVDYNERIIKIGYITNDCLPYLVQYWEQETREQIDRSRQRRKEDGHDSSPSGQLRK